MQQQRASAILCAVGLLVATSCRQRGESTSAGFGNAASPQSAPPRALTDPNRRYFAIRHRLEIETREADLQKAWDAINRYCPTIKCEVVSASYVNRNRSAPPSGTLSVRVAPDDLSKLFEKLGQAGNLVQHSAEAEDKTATVIDVEAKINNLSGFRDGLRAMLAKPPAAIKDLLEVQRELTQVQAQLDSELTRRKVLADETDKVSVEMAFRTEEGGRGASALEPVTKAFRESLNVLGESIAVLISIGVAIIPWIGALLGLYWLTRKLWRRRKTA